jgi:hypothetical protein
MGKIQRKNIVKKSLASLALFGALAYNTGNVNLSGDNLFDIPFYPRDGQVLGSYKCGNPADWQPDDSQLQDCWDKGVYELDYGWPGYIVNGQNGDVRQGLVIKHSGAILASASPQRARIIAGRDFNGTIIKSARGISGYEVRGIIIDGMVDKFVAIDGTVTDVRDGEPYRRWRNECGVGSDQGNVILEGNNFVFDSNFSLSAMCGSGLGLHGSDFTVTNNFIAYNGRDRNDWELTGKHGFPWADGITAILCERGRISNNTLQDNTDIDLAIGGGAGCIVNQNLIYHAKKYAFAGLNIGNYNENGDHLGSIFSENTVYSAIPDRLAMGILVGSHPWEPGVQVWNAGTIERNRSYRNVINMLIEGVYRGVIKDNLIFEPEGNDTNCGAHGLNYGVNPNHVNLQNTYLQPGWAPFQFDGWRCGPL